jgi:uracil-DNA glycosylase
MSILSLSRLQVNRIVCIAARISNDRLICLSSVCYFSRDLPGKYLAELMLLAKRPEARESSTIDIITLNRQIIACEKCPRLIGHCREVAVTKRRAFLDWNYWGKPVPSFGDVTARLLILGLAPGAHGANRTGRMFTGDRSGDFLYRSLHRAGFASQPESRSAEDGLQLKDAWITASAHCAPPGNKPTPAELLNCRPFFERELEILTTVQVVVALGKIAFDTYLGVLKRRGEIARLSDFRFGHGELHALRPALLGCYHPSQQNTSTGKLTQAMLDDVFVQAAELIRSGPVPAGPPL